MAGMDIIVPGSDAGLTDLPYIDDKDGILVPGSLVLLDFAHPAAPLSGVPSNGATIENHAWEHLIAAHGSGDQAASRLYYLDAHLAADAIIERTGKGGLHAIYSQVGNTNSNRGVQIASSYGGGPTRILASYLAAHPTNDYYVSMWGHVTRVALTGAPPLSSIFSNAVNQIDNRLYRMDNTADYGATLGSEIDPAYNTLGNFRRSIGTPGWVGTAPTSGTPAQGIAAAIMFGNGLGWQSGASYGNKSASWIAYRYYLEDLTVSGRSYDEVDEIDAMLHAAAFGSGGRYAGDTFTAVSALP